MGTKIRADAWGVKASRKKFRGRAEAKVGRGRGWTADEDTHDPRVGRVSWVLL